MIFFSNIKLACKFNVGYAYPRDIEGGLGGLPQGEGELMMFCAYIMSCFDAHQNVTDIVPPGGATPSLKPGSRK